MTSVDADELGLIGNAQRRSCLIHNLHIFTLVHAGTIGVLFHDIASH